MIEWKRYGNDVVIKWEAEILGLTITTIRLDGHWKVDCPGLVDNQKIETGFAHCAKRIAITMVLRALELRQVEDAKRIEALNTDREEW